MLAIAKTVIARPRTKHEKILIQKIKEEGSIPAFLELYDGMWTVDPNYTNLPDYFFTGSGLDRMNPNRPCWIWLGRPDEKGYGEVKFDNEKIDVHRLAYQVLKGPIGKQDPKNPFRLEVDHKCQNSLCFNPTHLKLIPKPRNLALIKLRERYHMQQPKSERDKLNQMRFLTSVYAQEMRLANLTADAEASLANKIHSAGADVIREKRAEIEARKSDLEMTKKYHTPVEEDEIPVEDRANDIGPEDLQDPEDLEMVARLDAKMEDPRVTDLVNLHRKQGKSSRELIHEVERAGWHKERQEGSHNIFEKPGHPHHINIVHPKKDESIGVERKVEKELACARQAEGAR